MRRILSIVSEGGLDPDCMFLKSFLKYTLLDLKPYPTKRIRIPKFENLLISIIFTQERKKNKENNAWSLNREIERIPSVVKSRANCEQAMKDGLHGRWIESVISLIIVEYAEVFSYHSLLVNIY